MTPDERFIQMARFNAAHAKRVWDGSAATEDAPAWYGRVATLIRAAAAPATEDELAGESDIVARMEAAMLEPAAGDELSGETEIVARMQATILGLATNAADDADDAGDPDRPRHLRPAPPGAARRRHGARVVSRIVAVKAAAVTTVVAIGVTAAAATTGIVATVVVPALSKNEPKHEGPETTAVEDSGSSAEGGTAGQGGRGGTADDPPVMNPDEPFTCMIDLDCLLHEVAVAAGIAPASAPPTTEPAPTTTTPTTEPAPPTTTTPTTEPPPVTTTTEPPPVTTTSEPPPTTTSTTEPPPPPEQAAEGGSPVELAGPLSDSGGTTLTADAQAADLGAGAQTQPAG